MAKTDLTLAIEQAIQSWHPAKIGDIKINTFRGEHTALEVPVSCGTTADGIVDAVRVSEYFGDIERRRICIWAKHRKEGLKINKPCDNQENIELFCDRRECRWNGISESGTPKVLITCFEIKVTKADFKSTHGHNFVGNMNYYAIPEEIYKDVEPLIPPDIGVLVYYHNDYYGLRTRRRPTFRDMTDEDQKWMILSVLKRIRRERR